MIGDLPTVNNNHKFLEKFHSGTLRSMDAVRLMSLFSIIARPPIGVRLKEVVN